MASRATEFRDTPAAAVARHYDELDAFYRDVWGEHVHHGLWRTGTETPEQAVVALVDYVGAAVRLRPADDVIDVGAGYEGTARRLASRFGVSVTGLTISRAQYDYAQQVTSTSPARILLGDWHRNALPAHSADAVIAIESTEHMADIQHALGEMHRVLRPEGRVAMCVWLASDRPAAWQRRRLLDPICREGRLVTLTTASGYARLLKAAGFVDVEFEDLTPAVTRTWTVCLRRVAARALSDRRYLRFAFGRGNGERVFLATMLRIAAAYRTGAMRYGLFTGRRAG